MYRPRSEYHHRPYKTNSRSGADIFFAFAQIYIIVFTLITLTRWVSEQSEFQFQTIVIKGTHAVSVPEIEKLVRAPMYGRLLWIWRKDNSLLYPASTVEERIAAADQRIASVAVASSRRQVVVTINEYHPSYRYCLPHLGRSSGGTLTLPTGMLGGIAEAGTSSPIVESSSSFPLAVSTSSSETSASSSLSFSPGDRFSSGFVELPQPETIGLDTHDCYWADDRGYIFALAPEYSGSPLLTITESDPSRNATLAGQTPVGTYIFDEGDVAHFKEVVGQLAQANFVLRRVVRMPSGDVLLDVGHPWNIALNLKNDPKIELEHFFLSLKELGDAAVGDASQLKVIDVRFGNKVFYR
jgi:hypothetical protein